MKNAFLFAVAVMLSLCCNNGSDPDDQCRSESNEVLTFTSGGVRISKDEVFDTDGNLQRYYTFTFDPAGEITDVSIHNASGTVLNYIINTLNSSGNTEKETYLNADSVLVGYTLYTFNGNARVQLSKEYDSANALMNVNRYSYDANGSVSEIDCYNADEILLFKQVHIRNENGQLLRVDYSAPNGTKLAFKTFTYDNRAYTIAIDYHDCTTLGKRRADVSCLQFDCKMLLPGGSFK